MPDPRQGKQTADVAVTVVALIVHAFLLAATVGVLDLLVIITDSCGSRRCGDPAWISRAMWLGLGAGAAFLVADVIVAVTRLARRKVTFFIPLVGCAAQLALAIGAAALETLAGPV
jgi:hypothetical protein